MSTATAPAGSLPRYLLTRLALVIPMVWILVTVVFFLMRGIGDPITAALGGRLPPEQLQERIHEAGYDRPLPLQYGDYLWQLLHGDLGTTISDNRPVTDVLAVNGTATLELAVWSFLIALAVGIPLGRLAARRRDKLSDVVLRISGVLFYAAPVFFVGMLGKLFFSVWLNWLPPSGRASNATRLALGRVEGKTNIFIIDAFKTGDMGNVVDVLLHTIMPALTLGLLTGGIFLRLVRTNMLQTMRDDYVEAARARGVGEGRVLRKHAFRNAMVPVVTVMGLQAALMLAGAILTETTFEWKGLGFMLAQYLRSRDYVAVQGIVTIMAIVVVLASFIIDIITALIDPRVRYQ